MKKKTLCLELDNDFTIIKLYFCNSLQIKGQDTLFEIIFLRQITQKCIFLKKKMDLKKLMGKMLFICVYLCFVCVTVLMFCIIHIWTG